MNLVPSSIKNSVLCEVFSKISSDVLLELQVLLTVQRTSSPYHQHLIVPTKTVEFLDVLIEQTLYELAYTDDFLSALSGQTATSTNRIRASISEKFSREKKTFPTLQDIISDKPILEKQTAQLHNH